MSCSTHPQPPVDTSLDVSLEEELEEEGRFETCYCRAPQTVSLEDLPPEAAASISPLARALSPISTEYFSTSLKDEPTSLAYSPRSLAYSPTSPAYSPSSPTYNVVSLAQDRRSPSPVYATTSALRRASSGSSSCSLHSEDNLTFIDVADNEITNSLSANSLMDELYEVEGTK